MTVKQPADKKPKKEESYLEKGENAFKQGEYDLAIQYFRQLMKWEPDVEKYRELLSQAELEKAKSQVNVLTKPFYLIWAILLIYIFRMYKSGIKTARILAKSSPGSKLCVDLYTTACFKLKLASEAIQTYEIFLKEHPFDEKVLKKLSDIYYDRLDYPNAVRTLNALRKLRPEDPEINKKYDVAVTQKYTAEGTDVKKLERIEQERQKVEARKPKIDEKKVNMLIEQCKKKPDDVNLRLRLARMLKKGHEWEQAAGVLEAAHELAPDNDKVLSELAEVYDRMNEDDKQVAVLEKLTALQPEDQSLKKTLIDLKIRMAKTKPAETTAEGQEGAEEKEEKGPSEEEIEQLKEQRLDIEIEEHRQKIKDNPANPDLQLSMGKLLREKGDLDEAIKHFQQAARNPTRSFFAGKLLGQTFYEKGMHDLAVEQLERALERKPSHKDFMTGDEKEIHYLLSRIHEEMDQLDQAIEHLQPVYEEDINYKDVQDRFEQLYQKRSEARKKAREEATGSSE